MPLAAPLAAVGLHELAGLPDAQRRGVGGQFVRPPAGFAGARAVPLPLFVGDGHADLHRTPYRSAISSSTVGLFSRSMSSAMAASVDAGRSSRSRARPS